MHTIYSHVCGVYMMWMYIGVVYTYFDTHPYVNNRGHTCESWYLTCAIPSPTQIQYMWSGRLYFHNSCTSLCFWHHVIPHQSSDMYSCNHHHKQRIRLRFHSPCHTWVTCVRWYIMNQWVWIGCIIHIHAPVYKLVCIHVIYQCVMLTHMYKFPLVYDTRPQWLHHYDIPMLHQ